MCKPFTKYDFKKEMTLKRVCWNMCLTVKTTLQLCQVQFQIQNNIKIWRLNKVQRLLSLQYCRKLLCEVCRCFWSHLKCWNPSNHICWIDLNLQNSVAETFINMWSTLSYRYQKFVSLFTYGTAFRGNFEHL